MAWDGMIGGWAQDRGKRVTGLKVRNGIHLIFSQTNVYSTHNMLSII